jgi:two-component system invasion response regulator UvrY
VKRVLVVDDSEALRGSLRDVLIAMLPGVEVREAAAALPALAAIVRESWDLVMLDLSLPDRGGVETLRDIHLLRPELPVVVMSLHAEDQYRAAMRAAGAADYVSKGSPAQVIVAVVRGILETWQGLAASRRASR